MKNVDPRVGRGHFLGVLDVKNRGGGAFEGGVWVRNSKIYRKYIDVQRKFKCLTREEGIFEEV